MHWKLTNYLNQQNDTHELNLEYCGLKLEDFIKIAELLTENCPL